MRVLLLSPYGNKLARTIRQSNDTVILFKESISQEYLPEADFVVMFGWRKIIKDPMLSHYKDRIINVHASYLPWNRGSYPNLFSWVENTPKGVSIHHVNGGLDTGRIIVRSKVKFDGAPQTTLKSSYNALQDEAENLFDLTWHKIRLGVQGMEQNPKLGSYHNSKDAEPIIARLPNGWDTKVSDL